MLLKPSEKGFEVYNFSNMLFDLKSPVHPVPVADKQTDRHRKLCTNSTDLVKSSYFIFFY